MPNEYSLEQDHKEIKEQIKNWELRIDDVIKKLNIVYDDSTLGDIKDYIQPELELISEEMMSINI